MPNSIVSSFMRFITSMGARKQQPPYIQLKTFVPAGELIPRSMDGKPLPSDEWDFNKAVELGFKQSPLTYIAVSAIGSAVSTVRWNAETLEGGTWTPTTDHDLAGLLQSPHPFFSFSEIMRFAALHVQLDGNGLIRKKLLTTRGTGSEAKLPPVGQLVNLAPSGVAPILSKAAWIKGYVFDTADGEKIYKRTEMIHIMNPDPQNPYWGMSPLQPLAKAVDTEKNALEWNMYSMLNRAISDGIFASKQPMTPKQYDEYREMVAEQHMDPSNAHAPWVLGGGFEWQEMSRTPVEMDFVKSMTMYRELVLSGLHVPPVMAGFMDNATLANAEVSRRLFWLDAVIPFINIIKQVLNRSLVPHFGSQDTLRINYDLTEVEALRDDTEQQSNTFYRLQRSGVPYNEAAQVVGLPLEPQKDGGDDPFGIMTPPGGVRDDEGGDTSREETPEATGDNEEGGKSFKAVDQAGLLDTVGPDVSSSVTLTFREYQKRVAAEDLAAALESMDRAGLMNAMRSEVLASGILDNMTPALKRAAELGMNTGLVDMYSNIGKAPQVQLAWLNSSVDTQVALLRKQILEQLEKSTTAFYDRWVAGEFGTNASRAAAALKSAVGLNTPQMTRYSKFFSRMKQTAQLKFGLDQMASIFFKERMALIGTHQAQIALQAALAKAYEQGRADGLFAKSIKTWHHMGDGKVCEICLSLGGMRVPMDERFFSGYTGSSYKHPGETHSSCRCYVTYEVFSAVERVE